MEEAEGAAAASPQFLDGSAGFGQHLHDLQRGLDVKPDFVEGELSLLVLRLQLGHEDVVVLDELVQRAGQGLVDPARVQLDVALGKLHHHRVVLAQGRDSAQELLQGWVQGLVHVEGQRRVAAADDGLDVGAIDA